MSKAAEAVRPSVDSLSEKNKAASALKIWRRITQSVFLVLLGQWSFYGIFRCPFIIPYISCRNCPVITCHGRLLTMFWGFWLLLPVSVLILGRAFCGWACPGGLVSQLFGMVAPLKLRTRNIFTRTFPYLKYLGLAIALCAFWGLGQSRENIPIRVGEFFASVALTFEHANSVWIVRTLLVLGFLACGLFLANVWCRMACPTGGILEFLKTFSWLKIFKNHKCTDCNACRQVCEMGARPSEQDCTNCGDCLDICPENAIEIGHPRRNA